MDDNCGEWVECMGVASGCGEQEVGVASGSGWNLWVWLLGVVLRRYIDFLILLVLLLLYLYFLQQHPYFFVHLKKCFLVYTLFKIQERKSDRRSREIEQRKELQNTHTHKTRTCDFLLH